MLHQPHAVCPALLASWTRAVSRRVVQCTSITCPTCLTCDVVLSSSARVYVCCSVPTRSLGHVWLQVVGCVLRYLASTDVGDDGDAVRALCSHIRCVRGA